MVAFILYGNIGLGPDEAQYWTWSQQLDWGYYSKPPGIAWLIWIGSQLFGNTELGVRSEAVFVGSLIPLAVFWLAYHCQLTPRACFWSGVIMAFSPLGLLSTFFAITDGGMVLFWTLSSALLALAIQRQTPLPYIWLGIAILGGALFKWPIYLFWVLVLASAYVYPRIASWKLGLGVLISLLGLLPSVIWNSQHEWATFRHVFATLKGGSQPHVGSQANLGAFIGEQLLLLSPILGILLALAFKKLFCSEQPLNRSVKWCGWVSLGILGLTSVMALFQKMQGNWAVFAYPTAIVFLCGVFLEEKRSRCWLQGGLACGGVLMGLIFLIQSSGRLPYTLSPFRHHLGWNSLSPILEHEGYRPTEHFLFGDKYQTSSLLSFYGKEQKRAYFLNLHGIRKNQFSFWPRMAQEQKGKTGFYVLPENEPHLSRDQPKRIADLEQKLKPYFQQVTFLGIKPLFSQDEKVLKGAFIFLCENYLGEEPTESELY
jgi:hypothetical protein